MPPALILAMGGASINAASNTLVSVTYGNRRGSMLSLMATFGALGALLAPVLFLGSAEPSTVAARLGGLAMFAAAVGVCRCLSARCPSRGAAPRWPRPSGCFGSGRWSG